MVQGKETGGLREVQKLKIARGAGAQRKQLLKRSNKVHESEEEHDR